MKKILAILWRDIKSGVRDWLIVYLSIAPFLIALILRLLIPGVGDSALNIAILENATFRESIEKYAVIETVKDMDALQERILRMDDVAGVIETSSGFEMVLQGNESTYTEDLLNVILERISNNEAELPVSVVFSDMGWDMSPLKLQGGILLIIFTTVFGGMFIVLNLVDEKMHKTLKALNVSPATRIQVIFGKGLLGFVLPIIGSIGAAIILGFSGINIPMFVFTILSISLISVIIGFSIGIVSDEPIAAVASMKVVFVPVLASIFGAMFLADKWQWILYWSPFYWAYRSMHSILLEQANWINLIINNSIIVFITILVFIALRKRISNGFN